MYDDAGYSADTNSIWLFFFYHSHTLISSFRVLFLKIIKFTRIIWLLFLMRIFLGFNPTRAFMPGKNWGSRLSNKLNIYILKFNKLKSMRQVAGFNQLKPPMDALFCHIECRTVRFWWLRTVDWHVPWSEWVCLRPNTGSVRWDWPHKRCRCQTIPEAKRENEINIPL